MSASHQEDAFSTSQDSMKLARATDVTPAPKGDRRSPLPIGCRYKFAVAPASRRYSYLELALRHWRVLSLSHDTWWSDYPVGRKFNRSGCCWFRSRPRFEAGLREEYRRDAGATKTRLGRLVAAIDGSREIPGTFMVRCACHVLDVYEILYLVQPFCQTRVLGLHRTPGSRSAAATLPIISCGLPRGPPSQCGPIRRTLPPRQSIRHD